MKKLLTSEKIYINKSKILNAGRGVYAGQNIKKGEIIETCPFIDIPEYDLANLNQSILNTYFFFHGKQKEKLFIALGFGSIYNHTHNPNAKYKIKSSESNIEFIALKDIKKDEEITINYNQENLKNKNPLWFE